MGDEAPVRTQISKRMQPWNKIRGFAETVQRNFSHAGHDAHTGDHVSAVGNLHTDAALRRSRGTENVGHYVHGAALHGALE